MQHMRQNYSMKMRIELKFLENPCAGIRAYADGTNGLNRRFEELQRLRIHMPHHVADVLKFEILNCLHKILCYYEFMKKKVLIFKISSRPTICVK